MDDDPQITHYDIGWGNSQTAGAALAVALVVLCLVAGTFLWRVEQLTGAMNEMRTSCLVAAAHEQ